MNLPAMFGNDMSGSTTPATYGGSGWRPRTSPLAAEIEQGQLWHRCGAGSEVSTLKEVILSWPSDTLDFTGAPDDYLMLAKPNLGKLREQTEKLAEIYESQGVKVHLWKALTPPPPNFLFMRDLFWAAPEGIVLGRPAAVQRAGEERWMAEALAAIGVPIVLYPHGLATFEGADALWLDASTVLLGTGVRTNAQGHKQLKTLLADSGVSILEIALPPGVQHLLGVVNFLDRKLVALHQAKADDALRSVLRNHGISLLELPPDDELTIGRGMNFVALGPRRIVMPAGCPTMRRRFEKERVETYEVDVSEYLKAAGGPGCVTGILLRD